MSLLSKLKQRIHSWTEDELPVGSKSEVSDEGSVTPAENSDLGNILPLIGGTALISAALVIVLLRFTTVAVPRIVTFDVVKYVNAERAMADKMFGKNDVAAIAPSLLNISKHTRAVIREVAGPHTIVVIRQAIVQGQTNDITDAVLSKLGLPTNVPTSDPTKYALDLAPTELSSGSFLKPKAPLLPSTTSPNAAGLP